MPLATTEWRQTFLQSSDDVKDHQCGQIKKMHAQQDMRSQGLLSNLLPSCEEQDIRQLETKTIRFGLECKLSTYAPPCNYIWTSLAGNWRLGKVMIEFIEGVNRCRKCFCWTAIAWLVADHLIHPVVHKRYHYTILIVSSHYLTDHTFVFHSTLTFAGTIFLGMRTICLILCVIGQIL